MTPRIHGELLKLGLDVSERTISRLIPKRRSPPSQTWRTFLANHVRDLVAVDFFMVPTVRFRVLFILLMLAHDRRRVVHFILGLSFLRQSYPPALAYQPRIQWIRAWAETLGISVVLSPG